MKALKTCEFSCRAKASGQVGCLGCQKVHGVCFRCFSKKIAAGVVAIKKPLKAGTKLPYVTSCPKDGTSITTLPRGFTAVNVGKTGGTKPTSEELAPWWMSMQNLKFLYLKLTDYGDKVGIWIECENCGLTICPASRHGIVGPGPATFSALLCESGCNANEIKNPPTQLMDELLGFPSGPPWGRRLV